MIRRQVRYYKYSESNPERHYYNVLIINDTREISSIEQKLKDAATPISLGTNVSFYRIVNRTLIDGGRVEDGSGLNYELICLETTNPNIDFSKVFHGLLKQDRDLRPRKSPKGWFALSDRVSRGEI